MPIAPIFASPYDRATRLPKMIAEFLDIENCLKRRFREDSISETVNGFRVGRQRFRALAQFMPPLLAT